MNIKNSTLKYAVVIPARYESSRFPGKPLADILGKSMIQRVWEQCCKAVPSSLVYVATDSNKIQSACKQFGSRVIMTSSTCLTGTDRLAEANESLDCDFIVNVQGDEPLIDPSDIRSVINAYISAPEQIINAMCEIKDEREFRSFTVPKVVASKTGALMYMSRSPIPVSKTNEFTKAFKQVCIYAFSRKHLQFFYSMEEKTAIENIEDIEILRFLENDVPVKMIEVSQTSIAVDIPDDLEKVVQAINSNITR